MAKLTELQLKKLKHSGKSKNNNVIKDIENLYIEIKPSNTKSWTYRYYMNGRTNKVGLGGYPKISIKEAREKVYEFNILKAKGIDPKSEILKQKNQKNKLFINMVNIWLEKKQKEWSPNTYKKIKGYLDKDILPVFKNRDIDEIEYIEIVSLLKEYKSTPTKQSKIKTTLSGIYKLAKANGLCNINPVNEDLCIVMERQSNNNYSFIHPIDDKYNLSRLLNDIDNYNSSYLVKKALQLAPYLAFRPSMIVSLKWNNFNEKERLLVIDGDNMKMKKEFKQPLSDQAFNILLELKQLTGKSEYIFTNRKGKHITPDSLRAALQTRLGYDGKNDKPRFTTHGWRHVTSTGLYYLQRKYKWQSEAIEMVLDHQERNKVKAVYNNYDYLDERREILSRWADFIDSIKDFSNKIYFDKVG
ncbi:MULTISPECIES: tyrosine-type recombinase/integrase [unclassified Francisella]|uniref:tyrosine-type recombinase/integrase n=1 Tax=unclassified Francisella TaxID=2610885 RepID=UPI002E2F2B9B|nr:MULTISPECIES: tyrosine-type recombinase/integrase [unclassified Francisella]MED7818511.1 tyrosine-type recombinase/integrase [Francisella sp. 19S2-4]MED7829347.1 tyrosine-type recombinase/integrase [Francisella sp. 19S2-10]